MSSKRSRTTISNWMMTTIICMVLGVSIVLCVIAVVSSGESGTPQATATPTAPTTEEEDSFDPNEVIVRENPVVMTVDLLPVKYSEFCYFYYISAGEVLEAVESPEDVIANGVDGTPFKTLIFNMAKEYAAKYVLYRQAYERENYTTNETYELYLQSNYMMATDDEELAEMNEELLYQFGIVRNEYIDILVYNDAIGSYKKVLGENAAYTDVELEQFYDEKDTMFREKEICFIELEKTDEALANRLVEQIKNGQDMKSLVSEHSISSTKYSDGGFRVGNVEDFAGEHIRAFLATAKKGDVAVVKEENAIYVVRCENDGSFAQKKEVVKKYKAIYDFDVALTEKIENEQVSITVEEGLMERLELPAFLEEFVEGE